MGAPKNQRFYPLLDPIFHFGFYRQCGIASGEQVLPLPLGWYFIPSFLVHHTKKYRAKQIILLNNNKRRIIFTNVFLTLSLSELPPKFVTIPQPQPQLNLSLAQLQPQLVFTKVFQTLSLSELPPQFVTISLSGPLSPFQAKYSEESLVLHLCVMFRLALCTLQSADKHFWFQYIFNTTKERVPYPCCIVAGCSEIMPFSQILFRPFLIVRHLLASPSPPPCHQVIFSCTPHPPHLMTSLMCKKTAKMLKIKSYQINRMTDLCPLHLEY